MLDTGPRLFYFHYSWWAIIASRGLSGDTWLCMNGLRDLTGAQQSTVNFKAETKVRIAVGWQPVSGD
jgi:hypothetical protein